ncbi:hypothetical protein ACIA5G_39530 [Amycolatopsis sp. NPDC051758]|uniref:hypothetical protein n=1 Tax=Amycolatopsis sp. NPDC051758 TaxID=3363935 RepID=UPI0037895F8E
MTRHTGLPTVEDVCAALAALHAYAETTRPPTVLALAQRVGLSNTTFRRHFPAIVAQMKDSSTTHHDLGPADGAAVRGTDRLAQQNARLRQRNRELSEHLALATAEIQRLSIEAHRLRGECAALRNVSTIHPRRPR